MADEDADEGDPADDGVDEASTLDDDEPAPLTGLGAIGQLLAALLAVTVLGVILLGAAAVLARLFR